MKVCHFIASQGLGRGEVYVDLANALVERGVQLALLVPAGAHYLKRLDPRIEVHCYRAGEGRRNPLLYLELWRLLRLIRPDLVHCHFAKATEIFQRLNQLLRFPYVATKHNPRKGRIFNRIPHPIAVSAAVAASIRQEGVRVIHNGITPVPLPAVDRVGDGHFKILAVGRLEQVKAFDRLIEECRRLDFPYRLQIVGDGPEKGSLQALAAAGGGAGKVELSGYREDIPQLMQAADAVVVCSHSEGFCQVILEALFYGNLLLSRPVGIADQILPVEYLIADFAIAAKLREVHDDYERFRSNFALLAQEQRRHYSMTACAEEHQAYYRSLLGLQG